MWDFRKEELPDGRGQRFMIGRGSQLTFANVLDGWQNDASFRARFNAELAGVPYSAFRWETPAVTNATASQPFEFVVLDSPGLTRTPEPEAFAEHFRGATATVIDFPNLGGDAIMVVPRPLADVEVYVHLAAFVRGARGTQQKGLWEVVAAGRA